MAEALNPTDVMEAVLLFFDDNYFENDREKIHTAFYALREKHKDLLAELSFKRNILFPRSRVLDDSLANLQPDYLGKINPNFDKYEIKKERIKEHWEKKLKSVLGDKTEELKAIAHELRECLNK